MPSRDTPIDVARRQRSVFASKSPGERVAMVSEMSALVRELALEGIRRRHPGISEGEMMVRLVEVLHGRSLAEAAAPMILAKHGG